MSMAKQSRTRIAQLEGRQFIEVGTYMLKEDMPYPKLIGLVCQAEHGEPVTIALNQVFTDALIAALVKYRPMEGGGRDVIEVGPSEGSGVWS